MAARVKSKKTKETSKFTWWASIALAVLGAADAIYLFILKTSQNELMCVGNHGCITVNNSVYSEIYGIPVSVFGLLGYLAILAILVLEPRWKVAAQNGPLAIFGMGIVGVLFSAYLTYVEAFVIYAYCPFCVGSAIIMSILFVLAIIRLVKHTF